MGTFLNKKVNLIEVYKKYINIKHMGLWSKTTDLEVIDRHTGDWGIKVVESETGSIQAMDINSVIEAEKIKKNKYIKAGY